MTALLLLYCLPITLHTCWINSDAFVSTPDGWHAELHLRVPLPLSPATHCFTCAAAVTVTQVGKQTQGSQLQVLATLGHIAWELSKGAWTVRGAPKLINLLDCDLWCAPLSAALLHPCPQIPTHRRLQPQGEGAGCSYTEHTQLYLLIDGF
jgi:hypothetical protein